MSNILPTGLGAPIVKVYTSRDEIVEKIVNFKYKHAEDSDEECIIIIEDDDVDLPEREEFQEGAKLHVVWGYIKGVESKKRIIFIRDITASFTGKSIRLTLFCYDKFASAKQNTRQKVHKNITLDSLAQEVADLNGLQYDGVRALFDDQETVGLREPAFLEQTGDHRLSVDNTSFPVMLDFRQYTTLPQGNKSDEQLLQEVAAREPGGPYVVEGRDEDLIIKKRNLNQKPIKTYTHGGGGFDLIEFTPETKNRLKKSANVNIESAGWDPIKKEFIQVNSNAANVDEDYLGDSIDGSPRANQIVKANPGDIENQDTPLDEQAFVDPETGLPFADSIMILNTEDPAILEETGYTTAAISTTAVVVPLGVLDYTVHEDTIENNLEDIKAPADNRKANASLSKNPATALIVGDPQVVSGKVITILNVSKKYSGNYYIIEATHLPLYNQGYLMKLKLIKNATGKTKTSGPDTIETKDLEGIINKEVGPEVVESNKNTLGEATPADPAAINLSLDV